MRLLIITPEYAGHGGGIMTYYRALAPALVEAGCHVHILSGSGLHTEPEAESLVQGNLVVETLGAARVAAWLARFAHLSAAPGLRRLLAAAWAAHEQASEAGPFGVIEVADFPLLAVPQVLAPLAPIVIQCHGSHGQISVHDPLPGSETEGALALGLEVEALRASVAAQSPSRANAAYWMSQTGRSVACLRPAWVGGPISEGGALRDQISVFGRVQRWKGPQVLCEALRRLGNVPPILWHGRDVALSARGDSTDAWLRQTFPDIWGARIITAPPVPPPEVAAIQSCSRLNLVPSTWDVFNFTVVEAMHSGRPVVCSNGAGASELVEDGVTGFVYDGTSPEALAACLERALAMPETRLADIGRAARAHVARVLAPRMIAQERIMAYEAIRSGGGPLPSSVPDWVRQIAMPREAKGQDFAFLEQQPLRGLLWHAGGRLLRKVRFPS
jgi:glycosyltransferase involved in cell wall biosynthesis